MSDTLNLENLSDVLNLKNVFDCGWTSLVYAARSTRGGGKAKIESGDDEDA